MTMGRPRKKPIVIDGVEYWRCEKCREYLVAHRFNKMSRTSSGLQSWCRHCMAPRARELYLKRRIKEMQAELAGTYCKETRKKIS